MLEMVALAFGPMFLRTYSTGNMVDYLTINILDCVVTVYVLLVPFVVEKLRLGFSLSTHRINIQCTRYS